MKENFRMTSDLKEAYIFIPIVDMTHLCLPHSMQSEGSQRADKPSLASNLIGYR